MRSALAIAAGRFVALLTRLRGGKGSGAPGLVTNRLAPALLPRALAGFPQGLVIVSGTAGKSTTTKMLAAILRAHGLRVFTNSSTANLPQGITSAILDQGDWRGRIDADIAVLELDEAHGARMAGSYRARCVVLTNVMLDDLERFHSMDRVAGLLQTIAQRSTESVMLNIDDAALVGLEAGLAERGLAIGRYGVSAEVLAAQPHGLGYAETAAARLSGTGTLVRSIDGASAVLELDGAALPIRLPARGTHFAVDAAAAVEAARALQGDSFDPDAAAAALSTLDPVFGRGETVQLAGQEIDLVLVQNTASFQLNVDALDPQRGPVFAAVHEEEHDPSWLWTIDMSAIGHVAIASGPKAQDLAARLVYDGVRVDEVDRDLFAAFDRFLAMPHQGPGRKTVLFTAQCMRDLRRHHGLVKDELRQVAS